MKMFHVKSERVFVSPGAHASNTAGSGHETGTKPPRACEQPVAPPTTASPVRNCRRAILTSADALLFIVEFRDEGHAHGTIHFP